MIIGSLDNNMEKVTEAILKNGGTTVGLNLKELAQDIYNEGNPFNFEIVGIKLAQADRFRFGKNYPWSTVPEDGIVSFSATSDARLLVEYLEIDSSTFNIFFAAN